MKSPILFDQVFFVRQILAASIDADVAEIGNLGEITYLVYEHVTQSQFDILDVMIASLHNRPGHVSRNMQDHRDSLVPYLEKTLLKVGISCATKCYECYIDPTSKKIVDALGFHRPSTLPDELVEADTVAQADWIFNHSGHDSRAEGQRVVNLLLSDCTSSELSLEELRLLAKGYNWSGQNAKALETAKLGLAKTSGDEHWLSQARLYMQNEYISDLPGLLSACDSCIREQIGPPAFWHLLKADRYIEIATGESEIEDFEWTMGDPILHPEMLLPAAEALRLALTCDPTLRTQAKSKDWVGDWDSRFAVILQRPESSHLRI